jgi:type IV secretory pathway protease TraF
VLIRLPPAVAELAHQRGYLPKSAYLIKIVLAVAGDHVCRFGTYVLVRGMFVRRALPRDRLGRRMPIWHGCRRLAGDELFVLANNPQSFDSRYFGFVSMRAVVGRAVLLWPAHR